MNNNNKYIKLQEKLKEEIKKIPINIEDTLCLQNILKDYKEQYEKNNKDEKLLLNIKEIEEYLN